MADFDTTQLTARIFERIRALEACSETPGRYTRRALTPAMSDAHALLRGWLEELGFSVRLDAAGNLIGRSPRGEGPALLTGSHLDTIVGAGSYDGILGVLLMLAAAEALGDDALSFPLEIIAFSDEEGVRFRRPYIGSSALVGGVEQRDLELVDADGVTLERALHDFGADPAELASAAVSPEHAFAFFEPHIEQGPVLEDRDAPLGVVTAICAQRWLQLSWRGRANHAGTTPMELRRDALAGAAELVLAAEQMARDEPGLLMTVGRIEGHPNVGNAVPGRVEISVDIRHMDDGLLERAEANLLARAEAIAARRQLELSREDLIGERAVACDETLRKLLAASVEACGYPVEQLASGAGHDARLLARRLPVAMLFLRSPGGLSHHPDETVLHDDVAAALEVSVDFLQRLDHHRRDVESHRDQSESLR